MTNCKLKNYDMILSSKLIKHVQSIKIFLKLMYLEINFRSYMVLLNSNYKNLGWANQCLPPISLDIFDIWSLSPITIYVNSILESTSCNNYNRLKRHAYTALTPPAGATTGTKPPCILFQTCVVKNCTN